MFRREFLKLLGGVAVATALPMRLRQWAALKRDRIAQVGDVLAMTVRGPFRSPMSAFDPKFKIMGPMRIAESKRRIMHFTYDGSKWFETARSAEIG